MKNILIGLILVAAVFIQETWGINLVLPLLLALGLWLPSNQSMGWWFAMGILRDVVGGRMLGLSSAVYLAMGMIVVVARQKLPMGVVLVLAVGLIMVERGKLDVLSVVVFGIAMVAWRQLCTNSDSHLRVLA